MTSFFNKWYSEACDVRSLARKVFELTNKNYDPNIFLTISIIKKLFKE